MINKKSITFFDDLSVYREGLLAQGFWALQIYRFGSVVNATKFRPLRVPLAVTHLILSKLSQIMFGFYIGRHARLGRRVIIEHFGCIIIHNNCVIGDDVTLRQGVTIGNRRMDQPTEAPIIGDRVNIGAGAKVLGRIAIGNDAQIGANAVVLVDVPPCALAVGVPARIIER